MLETGIECFVRTSVVVGVKVDVEVCLNTFHSYTYCTNITQIIFGTIIS